MDDCGLSSSIGNAAAAEIGLFASKFILALFTHYSTHNSEYQKDPEAWIQGHRSSHVSDLDGRRVIRLHFANKKHVASSSVFH